MDSYWDDPGSVSNETYMNLWWCWKDIWQQLLFSRKVRLKPGRYKLATKLNSTRSTLLKFDKVSRVALAPYTLATKLTVSATKLNVLATKSTATNCWIHVVADLLPVSATVNFQQSRLCWIQLCRHCVPGFTGECIRTNIAWGVHNCMPSVIAY